MGETTVRVKKCRHGVFCYFPHDAFIGRSLDVYGEYIEAEVETLLKLCRPGDIVVEVGANIGCDTVPIARHVGNAGRVVAFEPQRIIYQMLCANLALNAIWNVEAYQRGVGDTDKVMGVLAIDYTKPNNFGGMALREEIADREPVRVVSIDSVKMKRLDLLKVDVEGMEIDVIHGAVDTIDQFRPIIYMENDRKSKSGPLIRTLFDLEYDCWWHVPPTFRPENYTGHPVDVFGSISSTNMVCIPHERNVRVSDLKKVESFDELAPNVVYSKEEVTA